MGVLIQAAVFVNSGIVLKSDDDIIIPVGHK